MSVLQSRPEENPNKQLNRSQLPVVDTNAVLNNVIQQLPTALRSTLVLRCDELPTVNCDEKNLQTAFSELVHIITERAGTKNLFLYITCTAGRTETNEKEQHFIQFHTNLTPNEWLESNNEKVNHIASLLLPFGGSVRINQLKNSGCIFVLSLPRKQ